MAYGASEWIKKVTTTWLLSQLRQQQECSASGLMGAGLSSCLIRASEPRQVLKKQNLIAASEGQEPKVVLGGPPQMSRLRIRKRCKYHGVATV